MNDEQTEPWLPLRTLATWAVIVSLAFAAAGIAWPEGADVLLRILLVALVAGVVCVLAYQATQSLVRPYLLSPFDRAQQQRPPRDAPQGLRRLTEELHAANDTRAAQRANIPHSVRRVVSQEAAWRLAEHHGLRLDDPEHHELIRRQVSPPTWQLICPIDRRMPSEPRHRAGSRRDQPVPLQHLAHILDDLERL